MIYNRKIPSNMKILRLKPQKATASVYSQKAADSKQTTSSSVPTKKEPTNKRRNDDESKQNLAQINLQDSMTFWFDHLGHLSSWYPKEIEEIQNHFLEMNVIYSQFPQDFPNFANEISLLYKNFAAINSVSLEDIKNLNEVIGNFLIEMKLCDLYNDRFGSQALVFEQASTENNKAVIYFKNLMSHQPFCSESFKTLDAILRESSQPQARAIKQFLNSVCISLWQNQNLLSRPSYTPT